MGFNVTSGSIRGVTRCEYVTKEDKREEGEAPIFLNELRRVRRSEGVEQINLVLIIYDVTCGSQGN
jgi:hypothetical protein